MPESIAIDRMRVVAIVATEPSRELQRIERALVSIANQERAPDDLIVVVDHPRVAVTDATAEARAHAARVESLTAAVFDTKCAVTTTVLVNSRTKNVSGTGCWNTGIMYAIAECGLCTNPMEEDCDCFVSILDDDDEWKPSHIRLCVESVVAER